MTCVVSGKRCVPGRQGPGTRRGAQIVGELRKHHKIYTTRTPWFCRNIIHKTISPWFDEPRNVAVCETTVLVGEVMGSAM